MSSLRQWLENVGLEQHAGLLESRNVDLEAFQRLTDGELAALGIPGAQRRRLRAAMSEGGTARRKAERRQITVMFSDLVGSTVLSRSLDPEDLTQVISLYRDACAQPVRRYGGYTAHFVGDGVVAYFGYPQAHEDDAERAIRAGLELIEAVSAIDVSSFAGDDTRLSVRIGIATGNVVVGDLIGRHQLERDAVIGEAPNLAARLQNAASPNTVVIAAGTKRMAGANFEYRSLGQRAFQGIAERIHVWQVAAPRDPGSRFDAREPQLGALIDRKSELALLRRRWKQASAGHGQLVLIGGDPGIGKSRLAQALIRSIGGRLRWQHIQCSPHYAFTTLHPVLKLIERLAGFDAADDGRAKVRKLRALLERWGFETREALGLFAELLHLPVPAGSEPELTPPQKRRRILATLVDWVRRAADEQPFLLLVEDAQWMDPTTRALMDQLLAAAPEMRTLLLVTHRQSFGAEWAERPGVSVMMLDKLHNDDTARLVRAMARGGRLPRGTVDAIVRKADGVPLYAEEFTRSVLSGQATAARGGAGTVNAVLEIPGTIQSALMSRVDQLGSAKEVAQLAAAIGREFPVRLLARISEQPAAELAASLEQLKRSDLLLERDSTLGTSFTFRHSLIQEVAYGSLLKRERMELHRRIAEALQQDPGIDADPEILAFHHSRAGANATAIRYWQQAAQRQIARSAQAEAANLLERALEDLGGLRDTAERQRTELDLTSELAAARRSTDGYAAPEVEALYRKARRICEATGENGPRFNVEWGLMQCLFVKGNLARAGEIAASLFGHAAAHPDNPVIDAHLATGMIRFHQGDLAGAEQALARGAALGCPRRDQPHFFTHGQNPALFCLSNLAQTLWFMGKPDSARSIVDSNLAIARERAGESAHVYSYVNALLFAVRVYQCRRDAAEVHDLSGELISLARRYHYAYYEAIGTVRQGWAICMLKGGLEGVAQMGEGVKALERTGTVLGLRSCYMQLADVHARAGHAGEAMEALQSATGRKDRGTRIWDAELDRLRGDILLLSDNARDAEAAYRNGLDIARRQGARSLELRATTSFARLLVRDGRTPRAASLLESCIAKFSERHETPDMIEAMDILELTEKNRLN